MRINLPRDVEKSLRAKVDCGLFPSIDVAMTQAAHLLLEQVERKEVGETLVADQESAGIHSDEWARRLQIWVDSHPSRPITIDDSRESLYYGRD